jgi:4-hydroxybenzoate polyprenyltransferase
MKWTTALKLGRISNLPTIWTNALTGAALVNPQFDVLTLFTTAIALSLLYIAGMFLNDVYDLEWDRRHQPGRPLVTGEAGKNEALGFSIACVITAVVLLGLIGGTGRGLPVLLSTAALITLIILYDWKHKHWSFSPWLMGGCRLLVYLTAGAAVSIWNQQVLIGGLCLLGYIAGITYVARMEHLNTLHSFWPLALLFMPIVFVLYLDSDNSSSWLLTGLLLIWLLRAVRRLVPGKQRQVPRAVGALLAGIALIDTAILMALQQRELALIAAGCFSLCLLAQRKISPT